MTGHSHRLVTCGSQCMSPFESHRVGLTRIGVMATPHISADTDAFADTILLPGDPLRAKWIATNFLDDAVEVTAVRGMLGYTGTFKGKPISVMGTGMGVPSISIYASELIDVYGVEKLIRVGSCGSIQPHITVLDSRATTLPQRPILALRVWSSKLLKHRAATCTLAT
jgi:hypothetical protein